MRALTVLAAVLAGLTFGLTASGAPPETIGQIAYASNGAIHIVRADGTADRMLFGRNIYPAWSPDGARLAVLGVGSGFSLETVAADGVEQSIEIEHPVFLQGRLRGHRTARNSCSPEARMPPAFRSISTSSARMASDCAS